MTFTNLYTYMYTCITVHVWIHNLTGPGSDPSSNAGSASTSTVQGWRPGTAATAAAKNSRVSRCEILWRRLFSSTAPKGRPIRRLWAGASQSARDPSPPTPHSHLLCPLPQQTWRHIIWIRGTKWVSVYNMWSLRQYSTFILKFFSFSCSCNDVSAHLPNAVWWFCWLTHQFKIWHHSLTEPSSLKIDYLCHTSGDII